MTIKSEKAGIEKIAELMAKVGKEFKGPASAGPYATSLEQDLPVLCTFQRRCLLSHCVSVLRAKLNLPAQQP